MRVLFNICPYCKIKYNKFEDYYNKKIDFIECSFCKFKKIITDVNEIVKIKNGTFNCPKCNKLIDYLFSEYPCPNCTKIIIKKYDFSKKKNINLEKPKWLY